MGKPIYVTQPYLPPLEEFIPYLQEIWDKKMSWASIQPSVSFC